MSTQPVTVICEYPNSCGPLIYLVQLEDSELPQNAFSLPTDEVEAKIFDQIIEQRRDDDGEDTDRDSLKLKMAFKGDLYPSFDWRD